MDFNQKFCFPGACIGIGIHQAGNNQALRGGSLKGQCHFISRLETNDVCGQDHLPAGIGEDRTVGQIGFGQMEAGWQWILWDHLQACRCQETPGSGLRQSGCNRIRCFADIHPVAQRLRILTGNRQQLDPGAGNFQDGADVFRNGSSSRAGYRNLCVPQIQAQREGRDGDDSLRNCLGKNIRKLPRGQTGSIRQD